MNRFEKKNTRLIKAFGEYLREHLDVIDEIPDDAILVMQLAGDKAFNTWSRRIAQLEKGQPIVYVKFTLGKEAAKARPLTICPQMGKGTKRAVKCTKEANV